MLSINYIHELHDLIIVPVQIDMDVWDVAAALQDVVKEVKEDIVVFSTVQPPIVVYLRPNAERS